MFTNLVTKHLLNLVTNKWTTLECPRSRCKRFSANHGGTHLSPRMLWACTCTVWLSSQSSLDFWEVGWKVRIIKDSTTLTVSGRNFKQAIQTQVVGFILTPVQSGDPNATFSIKPYVRKDFNIGTDKINVKKLQPKSSANFTPFTLRKCSDADVQLLPGQKHSTSATHWSF